MFLTEFCTFIKQLIFIIVIIFLCVPLSALKFDLGKFCTTYTFVYISEFKGLALNICELEYFSY